MRTTRDLRTWEAKPEPLDGERPICKVFGCGKQLSLIESLAGNKCTKHMKEEPKYRSSSLFNRLS